MPLAATTPARATRRALPGLQLGNVARSTAVSSAATLLAEVRDDLALGFQEGFHTAATPRFVAPLVARLGELSMAKQAEALDAMPQAREPIAALDALVRVHQVLGIALSRLAAAAPVDPASLVRVPRMPSVAIPRPAEALTPEAAVSREASGELHRWERAYHVAVHYRPLAGDAAARHRSLLGDGFAAPFGVAAVPAAPSWRCAARPACSTTPGARRLAALHLAPGAPHRHRCPRRSGHTRGA